MPSPRLLSLFSVPLLSLTLSCSSKESNASGGDPSDAASPDAQGVAPPTPDSCITSVAPGTQHLECEGLQFDLTVPDVCLTRRCGLITDVHGFAMNGEVMNQHSRMREIAGPEGFIVLQPWAPGTLLTSAWSANNDVQVRALMQHVMDVWHVDPKRIHFDGYSMGGWMTWRFLCKYSDILASVAPIAAGSQQGGCPFVAPDLPARAVPILYTHGRTDGLVSFDTAITQRDAVLAAWYPGVQPQIVAQDTDYEWARYTNADGNVFEFIQHDWECQISLGTLALKGHCFPGVDDAGLGCAALPDGGVVASASHQMNWGETVLRFFLDHPMP